MVKKLEMMQRYDQDGVLVPVTLCQAAPCFVLGLRTIKKDGYLAVQLGAGKRRKTKKTKFVPEIIKEIRVDDEKDLPKLEQEISVDQVFSPGLILKATGVSKGRGFSGVIKRWGFHSQPATHGQSDRERAPGAIGAQTPGRVIKGKKMPGHYGNTKKTIKNLKVFSVDAKREEILIKGALPGPRHGWLMLVVSSSQRAKNGC